MCTGSLPSHTQRLLPSKHSDHGHVPKHSSLLYTHSPPENTMIMVIYGGILPSNIHTFFPWKQSDHYHVYRHSPHDIYIYKHRVSTIMKAAVLLLKTVNFVMHSAIFSLDKSEDYLMYNWLSTDLHVHDPTVWGFRYMVVAACPVCSHEWEHVSKFVLFHCFCCCFCCILLPFSPSNPPSLGLPKPQFSTKKTANQSQLLSDRVKTGPPLKVHSSTG